MIYRFLSCEIDTERVEVRLSSALQSIEPQVFHLISFLIENRHRVVSKEDLIDAVWRGRSVSDTTISSRISSARKALGDTGADQFIIRTIPRHGFRFIVEPEISESAKVAGKPTPRSSPSQTIRFCTSKDNVQIAYSSAGEGVSLIKAANWLNHLEFDWESPVFRPLFQALADNYQITRYDARGAGLSDWDVEDFSFDAMVKDLESVINATRQETFALLGISQGAAVAIDYAARFPQRVSHLILWGGFARGRNRRSNNLDVEKAAAFLTLMKQGWGNQSSAFRKMFASLYLPDANEEQIMWWTDLQRMATSAENAIRLRASIDEIDVMDRLGHVETPTLILHSERDEVAPISEARLMAANIKNATFVPLKSGNHLVMHQEPAWRQAVDEIMAFLAQ